MSSGDEELRELERSAKSGDRVALEQLLYAKIRRSPGLVLKLARRVIRLERVVTKARLNETEYYPDVALEELHDFVDREAPERPLHAGRLTIDGEWPASGEGPRGSGVVFQGGSLSGASPITPNYIAPPTNEELHRLILATMEQVADLTERLTELEIHRRGVSGS